MQLYSEAEDLDISKRAAGSILLSEEYEIWYLWMVASVSASAAAAAPPPLPPPPPPQPNLRMSQDVLRTSHKSKLCFIWASRQVADYAHIQGEFSLSPA